MGAIRDGICSAAMGEYYESDENGKPSRDQMDAYFQATGCWRDYASADSHSKGNWCGFFAIYCLRSAGLSSVHWGPQQGGEQAGWDIAGDPGEVQKVWGYDGIQPGDVAILDSHSHHIVVTSVDDEYVDDIEGNGGDPAKPWAGGEYGGIITTGHRPLSDVKAYFQIQE